MIKMNHFDFDRETQEIFNEYYSIEPSIEWKDWLNINSKEEFIETCLKNAGLSNIDKPSELIKQQNTDSRQFSVDKEGFIQSYTFTDPFILCHTSGTTNNNPDALKWFHMSKDLIKQLWAPGMKAIFEASGLDSDTSAVIFVPSRMYFDGINHTNHTDYISLYSSEFSQRLVISIFNPRSYVFYPYREVYNLDVLSSILSLGKISVVSAPAATLLKWADFSRFKSGIKKYITNVKNNDKHILNGIELYELIKNEGIDEGVRKIQHLLSEKITPANLIFSISSLNEEKWDLIRSFMKWEKGKEEFTNLYVGSEIGPFASSIPIAGYEVSRANKMYVFPLTLPVIDYKEEKKLITDTNSSKGRLLISRMHNGHPQINIDTGDIISIKRRDKLPLIGGDILRGEFRLKYQININRKIAVPSKYDVLAGNYFIFKNFTINDARNFLNYLETHLPILSDSLVLNSKYDDKQWELVIPLDRNKSSEIPNIKTIIMEGPNEKSLKNAFEDKLIDIKVVYEELIDFLTPRENILRKVREGKHPKGILKRWPLYVIKP